MGSLTNLELILTFVVLSFWIIFPVGMYLTMVYLEKNGRPTRRSSASLPLTP